MCLISNRYFHKFDLDPAFGGAQKSTELNKNVNSPLSISSPEHNNHLTAIQGGKYSENLIQPSYRQDLLYSIL